MWFQLHIGQGLTHWFSHFPGYFQMNNEDKHSNRSWSCLVKPSLFIYLTNLIFKWPLQLTVSISGIWSDCGQWQLNTLLTSVIKHIPHKTCSVQLYHHTYCIMIKHDCKTVLYIQQDINNRHSNSTVCLQDKEKPTGQKHFTIPRNALYV